MTCEPNNRRPVKPMTRAEFIAHVAEHVRNGEQFVIVKPRREGLRRYIEAQARAAAEGFKFAKLEGGDGRLRHGLAAVVGQSAHRPPSPPASPVNLAADRLCWTNVLQAVEGAWRWSIEGGRGRISRVVIQEPPDSKRISIEIRADL